MRIACANWSRRRAGGVESYLGFLLPELAGLGHEVALWSEGDGPADRARIALPATVHDWCSDLIGLEPSLQDLKRWSPSVLFVHGLVDPELERRLMSVAPAVLMAHSYYGTCISGGKTLMAPTPRPCSRAFGPACIALFYPRRCGGLSPLTMASDYLRQSSRLTLARQYGAVLTLSDHMRAEYLRHGLDPQRIHTLPRYLPSPPPIPASRPLPGGPLTLLFLGRLDRLKGCHVLLDALPHVARATGRAVHLLVGGDGPDRAACERQAAALPSSANLEVTFAGWIEPDTRGGLLGKADVFVLPSLWPEPYGIAGLEALAAGIPVAAFGSGGIPEWLRDGADGALAPASPPGAEGLAAAIVRAAAIGRRPPIEQDRVAGAQRHHVLAVEGHLASAAAPGAGTVH